MGVTVSSLMHLQSSSPFSPSQSIIAFLVQLYAHLLLLHHDAHSFLLLGHMLTVYGDVRFIRTISSFFAETYIVSFGNFLVTFFIVSPETLLLCLHLLIVQQVTLTLVALGENTLLCSLDMAHS